MFVILGKHPWNCADLETIKLLKNNICFSLARCRFDKADILAFKLSQQAIHPNHIMSNRYHDDTDTSQQFESTKWRIFNFGGDVTSIEKAWMTNVWELIQQSKHNADEILYIPLTKTLGHVFPSGCFLFLNGNVKLGWDQGRPHNPVVSVVNQVNLGCLSGALPTRWGGVGGS